MAHKDLGFGTIAAYGSVSLSIGLLGIPMAVFLPAFYSAELGLPLAAVGSMLILSRVTDFFTDPAIGILSDRWRPAIGRRKVWLPIGSLIMMLGVFLLFQPIVKPNEFYFFACVSLVYLGYTTLQLPYTAWGAELSPDYQVRTRITGTAKFFDTTGILISSLIPTLVFSLGGSSMGDVMKGLSLFFILTLPVCATLAFLLVPDRSAKPRGDKDSGAGSGADSEAEGGPEDGPENKVSDTEAPQKFRLKEALLMMARNKPFAIITGALLIATIAEVARQTMTSFYAAHILQFEDFNIAFTFYFISAILIIPLWGVAAKRLEKHNALIVALCLVFATNVGMFFLGPGDAVLFMILFVLKGGCFGALLMLPAAMIADTVDIDTVQTGEKRQGQFFAISAMVQKAGFAIGAGTPLILLDWTGFNAAGENGPDELMALKLMYGVAPAIVVLGAIFLLRKYALTAAKHKELQTYLEARENGVEAAKPDFVG